MLKSVFLTYARTVSDPIGTAGHIPMDILSGGKFYERNPMVCWRRGCRFHYW